MAINVRIVKVYDVEWEEYQVKVIVDKKEQKKHTYFADSKEDCIGTAKAMHKWAMDHYTFLGTNTRQDKYRVLPLATTIRRINN